MTANDIATKLADYCRKGEFEKAQKELFAKNAVSIEQHDSPEFEKETRGLDSIINKGHKFMSMVEKSYGNTVSDPIVFNNAIAFKLDMDVQMKGHERENMSELCVYEIKDNKIVSEHFYM